MVKLAHYIPLVPFAAFIVNIFFGKRLKSLSAVVAILASGASFILSLLVAKGFLAGEGSYVLGTWLTLNGLPFNFGVTIDALSVMMLLVVSLIGTLIEIYSVGYMHND